MNCFALKSFAKKDLEFSYLKWLFNNLNHIEKFRLHLQIHRLYSSSDVVIREYVVDANFIRRYCLPDTIVHIKDFQFYIVSECQLISNNIQQIINSFKIHQDFIDRKWINIACFYDPLMSYQHISSSMATKLQFMNGLQ